MFLNTFKNKKVLVTGHTGFKGSWLSYWLTKLGADVSGISLYVPSSPSHFETLNLSRRMQDIRLDINHREDLISAVKKIEPDIVFHLAAQPIVSASIEDPVNNFATNVMGSIHILEALRQTPSVQTAVMITSDKCYENVEWEFGYRESDRLGGKDPYSASKACAEIAFHSYFRTYFKELPRLQIATARAGNVIGGGDWAKDRIVPDAVKAWGAGEAPFIRSPHSTRPWQHVLEPLSGYLWLAARLSQKAEGLNGESFNFGPPAEVNATVEALLSSMTNHWRGKTWTVTPSAIAKKEAGLLKLCCDKALARLAWRPTLTLDETVLFTSSWYKSFYEDKSVSVEHLTDQQIVQYIELASKRQLGWTRSV